MTFTTRRLTKTIGYIVIGECIALPLWFGLNAQYSQPAPVASYNDKMCMCADNIALEVVSEDERIVQPGALDTPTFSSAVDVR
jgi:hypothetical protein